MGNSWRIGLFVGLAILGCQVSADAQTQAGGSAAGQPTGVGASASNRPAIAPPSASATTAAVAASRRRADSSFNRLATVRRASASAATRGGAAAGGSGMSGQDDPLRPYSARVREAQLQASTSTSRPQSRLAMQAPPAQSSRSYYPSMRGSQHPNANVPAVNRQGMGMGMGMNMGGRHCTPSRGAVMAGSLGRGR